MVKKARCESRCERLSEVVVQHGTRDLNLSDCVYTSAMKELCYFERGARYLERWHGYPLFAWGERARFSKKVIFGREI